MNMNRNMFGRGARNVNGIVDYSSMNGYSPQFMSGDYSLGGMQNASTMPDYGMGQGTASTTPGYWGSDLGESLSKYDFNAPPTAYGIGDAQISGGNTDGMETSKGPGAASTFGSVAGGLQSLGNLYLGYKGYGLAKDKMAQDLKFAKANYGNQVQEYNTNLADRAHMAMIQNNGTDEERLAYIKANSLKGM